MKKTILFLFLISLSFATISYSQTNKTTILFTLKKTFASNSTANVGGDLVIPTDQPPSNVIPICNAKNESIQEIYAGPSLASVFVNVTNAIGNGCVTLVVTTETGTTKETIANTTTSGLRKFLKVKRISVVIDHTISSTFPQTIDAKGNVDIWF